MKQRRPLTAALIGALVFLPLTACTAGSVGSDARQSDHTVEPAEPDQPDGTPDTGSGESADASALADSSESVSPSIVRTGSLSLRVDDPAAAAKQVADIADDFEGLVDSEELRGGDESTGGDLVLRVPADRFDDALDALGQLGEVTSRVVSSSDDVTTQHADLTARVAALEKSVKRLSDLMANAGSTGDLLEAEEALSARQQELDGLRAQLEALEDQVEMSTITVSLSVDRPLVAEGGPSTFGEAVRTGTEALASFGSGALIALGILLPWLALLAVLGGAVLLVVLLLRRRAARRSARAGVAAAPSEPAPADASPAGMEQSDGSSARGVTPGSD